MLLIILFCIVSILTYRYAKRKNSYFKNFGVKTLPPLPIVGNLGKVTLKKANFIDVIQEGYETFKDQRYFGLYQYMIPTVVPRDPDLIKQIVSQDFDVFQNRGVHIDEDGDPLFAKNLIMLRGKEWKDMRSMITPAFTASKMRQMLPFMLECAGDAVTYLKNSADKITVGDLELDTTTLTSAYTNDVIASCAFGFRVNTHEEKQNEIYKMGQTAVIQHTTQIIKFFGYENFPRLMKVTTVLSAVSHGNWLFQRGNVDAGNAFHALEVRITNDWSDRFVRDHGTSTVKGCIPRLLQFFKIRIIDTTSADHFRSVFTGAMKLRMTNNNHRPDFIQLLMEARKGLLEEESDSDSSSTKSCDSTEQLQTKYNDDDLVAQAVLFYVAGFDTTAHLIDFTLYELACNLQIQDKLYDELRSANEGSIDSIQEMKYLDMVTSEVLRLWPLVGSADRRSVMTYDFGPTEVGGEHRLIAKPDIHVWIPIASIHRDPEYWESPDKCDPERFSDENKCKIRPYTYIPFGQGPRYCIGSRFAILAAKVLITNILKDFEISKSSKTVEPMEISKKAFILTSANDFWIKLKRREK